jgi:hypothetical protein
MKKIFGVCAVFLAVVTGASAQDILLQDYDSTLSVWCSSKDLRFYVDNSFHIPPMSSLACGHEEIYHHRCTGDEENELARAIYLARLDMLHNPDIRYKPLSAEVIKIVRNFELITGIRNNYSDGDLMGRLYISSGTLQGWAKWLDENKDKLCYCPVYHVLYLAYQSE